MAKIKIRFNTQFASAPSPDLKWRVLVDGQELLCKSINVKVPSETSEDVLPCGTVKWHISCQGNVVVDSGQNATVVASQDWVTAQ